MKEKILLFSLAIVILAVSFLWIPNPELTGFATTEATVSSLSIALDSSKFAVSTPITGTLSLKISENIDPSELITITLNAKTQTYTIEELLEKANYSIEYESSQFNATKEGSSKTLSFPSAGSQFIGVKTPRYAEISDITFTVEGAATSLGSPTAVSMDFGNEGTIDWYYLGSFLGYNSTLVKSEDLDGTKEGSGYIDNETYYCEYLSLPRTKHLTVAANYTKLGTEGDIQALALSVPTGNPKIGWSGGSDTCDLPESGTNSCTIEFDYTIEGKYLLCIFSTGSGTSLYEVPLDNSQETDTAYTCPAEENSICKETTFNNFFIYVQSGKYNNTLTKNIIFDDWETFTGSIVTGIKYYVGSYPYYGTCKTTSCSVPINITSEHAGNLTVKDLTLTYDYNDITQSTSTFYDLELPQTDIKAIESQVLEDGATIEIPLEILSLTESAIGDYNLDISFQGTTAIAALSIRDASEVLDAKTLIQKATEKIKGFLEDDTDEYQMLMMLDKTQKMTKVLDELGTYKNQIGFSDDNLLVEEIEKTLADIPWEITSAQTKSETIVTEASDIPETLGDITEVYKMQESISVKGTLKTVTIKTYNKEETSYILIKKEITANTDLEEATLYEEFPLSFSELLYTERPEKSSGNQAQYVLNMDTGDTKELYYATTDAVSLSDFQSIVVLPETEEEEIIESVCGDFSCDTDETENSCPEDCTVEKEFPWIYVIIGGGIVFLIIILVVIKVLTTKKTIPVTQDPLVNFFRKGLAKGLKKEQLIDTLRKKGWKEADIQSAAKRAGL